ncbi:hypothetical protein IKG64_00755 [Candidatus Saccharibacteria bacterium]|nr:hypothetical protein [Candidatus Saccharibacteria bacterium]
MLIYTSKLTGTPVLSMQAAGPIGYISRAIVDPDGLKIIAFVLNGPSRSANLLPVQSIREYSELGMVIDSIDELVGPDDVIRLQKVLALNFDLLTLKVVTKKGSKLGKIIDYTVTSEDFVVQQLIVKRPTLKSFTDPELIIPRREIIEVTDYKVIVRDEEKTIRARAEKEDFIPNFVNPFRKTTTAQAKELKDSD